uniref:Uncharacterized protein n=1 Tax=viral metagenome TaxID=1070528 RepID=A0A6C0BQ27_9ZZZZ
MWVYNKKIKKVFIVRKELNDEFICKIYVEKRNNLVFMFLI